MAAWQALTGDEQARRRTQGVAVWKDWATTHASKIVEPGGPLGKTKLVSPSGIRDIRNNLAAFVIVEAESQEAAARLFIQHPHFTILPGAGVEIMEVLPVPAG
ncbi:MAG: hypothetical protein JSR19_13015 [Proteobacteria bacterium]|nr:hypothetical protein [Pseudomonadota bacterium]